MWPTASRPSSSISSGWRVNIRASGSISSGRSLRGTSWSCTATRSGPPIRTRTGPASTSSVSMPRVESSSIGTCCKSCPGSPPTATPCSSPLYCPGLRDPTLHVVLVEPEIHWNTGNAGRTCLAAGAQLHLVGPLGFSLEDKEVRRAGLDYGPRVAPRVWPDWPTFERALQSLGAPYLFTARAERRFQEV